jgi:hypothetical protein
MTKILSMVTHKNYKLSANEGFVIFYISKLIISYIDGVTSKTKSQSITYLLVNTYMIWDLDDEVHSI